MRTPKIYLVIVAGMIALFVQDSCNAQLSRIQPFQQFGRFLGNGHSVGYHICNPGPDTSYYNPWSHHNSFLIHRTPEYQSRFGNSDVDAYQLLLSGRSPHFQNQPTPFQGFSATPTTVDADFEPIGDDRDDSDSDSNGSSTRNDDDLDSTDFNRDREPVEDKEFRTPEHPQTTPEPSPGSGKKAGSGSKSAADPGDVRLQVDSIFQNSSFELER